MIYVMGWWIIPVAIILPDLLDCIYQNILGVVAKPEQINIFSPVALQQGFFIVKKML